MTGIILDAVLMLLLVGAVGYGIRLEKKLVALRQGQLAFAQAVEAGASEASVKVIDAEDIPIAYLPGKARRVRVRVVGDIGFA